MTDVTARMLAKAEAAKRFRDLEEAAAQSQREVRAGLRDSYGKPTKKGRTAKAPTPPKAPTPRRSNRPDRTDEIIAAYKAGTTIKRIVLLLRINQATVSRTLVTAGLRPELVRTTATPEEVVDLYKSGMTITAITASTRMTRDRISAAIHAAGVPMRARNHLKTATSCAKASHDWTDPKNVRVRADGMRSCAECDRIGQRERRAARKAAKSLGVAA